MTKKNRILIAILMSIIIILCIALGIVWTKSRTPSSSAEAGSGLILDDSASDWNKDLGDSPTNGIQIPGYGTVTVQSGSEKMQMSLVNPEGNPCYFQFKLIVHTEDNDIILYESNLVEPGKAITEFDVDNLPEKGTYKMTVAISTWSLKNPESALNGAEVATTLQVD